MVYLNKLIENVLVNIGEGNFLSEDLHVNGGQGLAGRSSPPLRKLCEEEKSLEHCIQLLEMNVRVIFHYLQLSSLVSSWSSCQHSQEPL